MRRAIKYHIDNNGENMNFFVVFVIVGACAVAAGPAPAPATKSPAALAPEAPKPETEPAAEAQRDKRSHGLGSAYGGGSYGAASPSAYGIAAAPAAYGGSSYGGGLPAISPSYSSGALVAPCGASAGFAPISGSLLNIGQHAGAGYGYAPQAALGGYSSPHYRADEQEEMSFSDMDQNGMEHVPLSRSYGYDVLPAASSLSGLSSVSGISGIGGQAAVSGGPAVGVFPGGHVGGCNLPLLVSCSPSIVPGRLVRAQPHYAQQVHYAPAAVAAPVAVGGAYRGADERPGMPDAHDDHQHELAAEHLSHHHQ